MKAGSRLVYQDKRTEGSRAPWARHMQCVADLLELRVAGAARVQRILNARVPIVKFAHHYTDLECDLCYNNMSVPYFKQINPSIFIHSFIHPIFFTQTHVNGGLNALRPICTTLN